VDVPISAGVSFFDGYGLISGESILMRYDKAPARRLRIAELVRQSGFCRSSELSKILGVSEMTIRRDLHLLAKRGLVHSVHGGARATMPEIGSHDFQLRLEKNRDIKKAIARGACAYLEANSIIALDAGTTLLEFTRALPTGKNLTVVTHSVPVMSALASREDIELIGLGGILNRTTQSFTGPQTLLALKELRVSTLFLATAAIQDDAMYSGNIFDTEMKRALIEIADKIILLVDSTKFRTSAGIRVAGLEEVDAIVTDDGKDVKTLLNKKGVEAVIVSRDGGQE